MKGLNKSLELELVTKKEGNLKNSLDRCFHVKCQN